MTKDDKLGILALLACAFIFCIIGAAVGEKMGHESGAIAAYKRQIVCAEVPQLNRAAEWQCKEVER